MTRSLAMLNHVKHIFLAANLSTLKLRSLGHVESMINIYGRVMRLLMMPICRSLIAAAICFVIWC
jgi:hypothetical protein